MTQQTRVRSWIPGPAGGITAAQWAELQAIVDSAGDGVITLTTDNVSALLVEKADGTNIFNVNTSGEVVSTQGGASLAVFTAALSELFRVRGSNGHLLVSGASPSSNVEAGAGAGATSSIVGTDVAGRISLNTGTGPATGGQVTITFASPYASTNYIVLLFPAEGDAASSGGTRIFVNDSVSTVNGFRIDAAGSALTASTSYACFYLILEYEP